MPQVTFQNWVPSSLIFATANSSKTEKSGDELLDFVFKGTARDSQRTVLLEALSSVNYRNLAEVIAVDTSSVSPLFEIANDTFWIEDVGEHDADFGFDEIVQCPPKNKYKIRMQIKSVKQGTPVIIEPTEPF